MRICLLCTEIFAWGKYGGFGRATRMIGGELVARGYEVHAIVPRRADQKALELLDGIQVHSFPMQKPWQVRSLCQQIAADLYHSCEPSMSTWFAMQSCPQARHMVTCRDPRDFSDWWIEFRQRSSSYLQVLSNWIYEHNWLVQSAVRRADAVYVPAQFLIEKVKRIYGKSCQPIFLPTPIPLPDISPKSSRPSVCYIARIDRRKRPELFCELAKRHPDVHFKMVGKARDAAYEEALRTRFSDVANLEFTGFIDQFSGPELSRLLNESWIMVNTASREGLPTSFLEGLAHGCALLSAVDPDATASRFGFHVRDDDFDTGLQTLLEQDRWRMLGESGRQWVHSIFSPEAAMQAHTAAYDDLMLKGTPRAE